MDADNRGSLADHPRADEIAEELKEHVSECANVITERTGIGHYEFWGQKCFDRGETIPVLNHCPNCEVDITDDLKWLCEDADAMDDDDCVLDALSDFLPAEITIYPSFGDEDHDCDMELTVKAEYKIKRHDGKTMLVAEFED